MRTAVLGFHPGLAQGSRLPALAREGQSLRAAEVLLLLGIGAAAAAATGLLDMGLRIPGNAILRAVFPMAFGLALVPRRTAGTVMGVGALVSAAALHFGGSGSLGAGALTSLVLTGPFLDVALRRARPGWPLYLGLALAGLGSNLAALAVRSGAKLVGLERVGARAAAEWWPQAVVSYALCGLLAGVVSGLVWFHFSSRQAEAGTEART